MINQLRLDVERLALPQGRAVGTPGHDAARDYLLGRLAELELEPYHGSSFALPYEIAGQRFTNLVARIPGQNRNLAPLLIGAHYDTCNTTPGADDNAAAVAILLDVAALLKNAKGDRDVIIAIFDAEEPPHFLQGTMGSINFYNRQRRESVGCAFIMDLVGHDVPLPGLEDLLFVTGIESHPDVESIIQSVGFHEAVRIIPTLNDYVGDMSDHHVFRTNGVPYLFLSCGRWEHYHMSTDTPDRLNYTKMRGVADVLFLWVRMIDAKRLESGVPGHDPLQTELRFMNAALGPLLDKMRMSSLSSRKDINKLVATLLDRFRL